MINKFNSIIVIFIFTYNFFASLSLVFFYFIFLFLPSILIYKKIDQLAQNRKLLDKNKIYISKSTKIKNDDEIAFFPPVTGG